MVLHENIRTIRKEKGLTQEQPVDFADYFEVSIDALRGHKIDSVRLSWFTDSLIYETVLLAMLISLVAMEEEAGEKELAEEQVRRAVRAELGKVTNGEQVDFLVP